MPDTLKIGTRGSSLALAQARKVASAIEAQQRDAVVIGSDQVAELDGQAIGKPHTHERATAQLVAMSGRCVVFHTALAVVRSNTGFERCELAPVTVRFRGGRKLGTIVRETISPPCSRSSVRPPTSTTTGRRRSPATSTSAICAT